MSAKTSDSNGSAITLTLCLVVGLLGLAIFQKTTLLAGRARARIERNGRAGAEWTQTPRTAAGCLLVLEMDKAWQRWLKEPHRGRRRLPRAEAVYHHAANKAVVFFNKIAKFWPMFMLLACLSPIAFRSLWRMAASAPRAGVMPAFAAAYVLLANVGLLATLPSTTPVLLRNGGLALAGCQATIGLIMLLDSLLNRSTEKRTFKYGPPFLLPADVLGRTAGPKDGVLVGKVQKDILPQHTRWTGAQGGSVVIPFDRLTCGVTVLGEKGSGKSRLLFAFHDAIRKRYPDVPMLIHDPKGEWYRTFFNPETDLVFAPHFERSSHWSIWSDFNRIPQLCHELIATAVYAHDSKGDTFWMDSAIRLLRSVAHFPAIDNATAQLNLMRKKNRDDKTWLSIYQIAQLGFEDIAKVELAASPAEEPAQTMSIDDYLKWPGRIFLLNDPSCATEQKGAFSLFLSAFMLRALSGPDLAAGRLRAVAIVDEALTFNLPPDVDRRIYALCRSKGLSIIAGAQRLPARHLHERGEWQTAEFSFGMKVISQDTQASLARRAGQIHYDQARHGRSESEGRVSKSESEQSEKLDAIPPEHFGRLAPRDFVLFHDRGLVTGSTTTVNHEQRNLALPSYTQRRDVLEFARGLQ